LTLQVFLPLQVQRVSGVVFCVLCLFLSNSPLSLRCSHRCPLVHACSICAPRQFTFFVFNSFRTERDHRCVYFLRRFFVFFQSNTLLFSRFPCALLCNVFVSLRAVAVPWCRRAVEGNNESWVVQACLHLTKLLVSRRAVVDSNQGSIALDAYAEACLDGYESVIRFMLDRGADVNGLCAEGNSPLMDAASMGHTKAVDLLLRRGAVVDLPNKSHHYTALRAACFKAHEGAVRLLLAAGASTTLEDSRGRSAMDYLAAGASTTLEDSRGRSAMDWATDPRHAAVRRLLQQHCHPAGQ
jgi:hypothetical protein